MPRILAIKNARALLSDLKETRAGICTILLIFCVAGPVCAQNLTDTPSNDWSSGQLAREATALITAGKSAQAYALLVQEEEKMAGTIAYDYLLGVAALDAGLYSRAIFALDRVAVSDPGFSGARMELARAHFQAGDNERARMHFLRLQRESPPKLVAAVIEAYLAAIDERARRYEKRRSLSLGARTGYDSNANASVDQDKFLEFTLSDKSTATESSFAALTLAASMSQPVGSLFVGGANFSISQRINPSASFVDSLYVAGSFLLQYPGATWKWTAAAGAYTQALDHSKSEDGFTVGFDLGRPINDDWHVDLLLRASTPRYKSALAIRDVDRLLYGLSATRIIGGNRPIQMRLAAIGGRDRATQRRQSPFSNVKLGTNLSIRLLPVNNRSLELGFGLLKTRFNGNGTFFGSERDDEQFVAGITHRWKFTKDAAKDLSLSLQWIENRSNIELYDYDRIEVSLALGAKF